MKAKKRIFIIPNDSKKEYDKFIGFHINNSYNLKLTLFGLQNSVTKSMLLREALFQYLDKFSNEDMIEEIAQKAYYIWMANYKDLNVFKCDLENDLRSRDLCDDLINKIIINFEKIKQANGS